MRKWWPCRYGMTPWVITLNEMSPGLEQLLPPTDTRLRADIRALEQGIYDKAKPLNALFT